MPIDNTTPTTIARLPFYYGWVILAVGSIGVLASIPGQTMGISVFTDHLIAALDLSRVDVSTAYMIGTLASSLLIPFAGRLLDRHGARVTDTVATILLSCSLIALANSPWLRFRLETILPIPGKTLSFLLLTLLFLGIRLFGQGMVTIVPRTMVAKWFGPRRGFAVGLMGIITVFGFSYAPQPLQRLIDRFGWQHALWMQAAMLILLFLPIVLIFFRSDPESCGMTVEQGMSTSHRSLRPGQQDSAKDWTVVEVRMELRSWAMMGALGFWALFSTAFTFHVVSIHEEIGVAASVAVRLFLPMSLVSVVAQFIGSYLSDRIPLKNIFLTFMICLIGAGFAMPNLGGKAGNIWFITTYGTASGLFNVLSVVTWPKLYGRKHLGAINGMAMSIIVAGSAVGPWLFSLGQNAFGTYRSLGLIIVGTTVVFLLLMLPIRFGEKLDAHH